MESDQPSERLTDSLTGKSLHLDVEELSEVAEPFNHLGGHTAVKLDSRKGEKSSRRDFLNDALNYKIPATNLIRSHCNGGTHLDIGEVRLESVGAWVAGVEEHELGFLQMTGRQSFLGVRMRPVKAFLPR